MVVNMREQKYRFWNTEEKVMSGILSLKHIARTGFSEESVFNPKRPEVITLQFTGLLDKNGVEVFEGDIVRSSKKNYWNDYDLDNYIVERLQDFFEEKGYAEGELGENWEEVIVLGNIYQNKELLTHSGMDHTQ